MSRLFEMILVLTGPGHNTLTPISNGSSSSRSDSERPTTANFEVVYRDAGGGRGESRTRSGVDDMPATAAFEHPRQEGLDSVDHSIQVDSDYPVPIFVGQARDVLPSGDAGVVAQN